MGVGVEGGDPRFPARPRKTSGTPASLELWIHLKVLCREMRPYTQLYRQIQADHKAPPLTSDWTPDSQPLGKISRRYGYLVQPCQEWKSPVLQKCSEKAKPGLESTCPAWSPQSSYWDHRGTCSCHSVPTSSSGPTRWLPSKDVRTVWPDRVFPEKMRKKLEMRKMRNLDFFFK